MTISARIPLVIGLLTVLVLIGGMGTWAGVASITSAVIAQGTLEPRLHRQSIQHPDGGVLDAVFVTEGQVVNAGQPIAQLEGHNLRLEQTTMDAQYFEILARAARLEAERDGHASIDFPDDLMVHAQTNPDGTALIDGQRRLFTARAQTLAGQSEQIHERIRQTDSQVAGYRTQITACVQQIQLVRQELADKQRLRDQGLVSATAITLLERDLTRLDGEHGALIALVAQAQARIAELRLEAINLTAQRREDAMTELRDLRVYEVQIRQQRAVRADQISRLIITAPIAGIVHNLQPIAKGSVLQPADVIAYIVPTDQAMIVTAQIAPLNRDAIYIGQAATLRFPSLSSATPPMTGVVTMISADMFEGERGRTYFRADITLPQETENSSLLPGMPVDVFLATGAQSAAHYLFKPVMAYFHRAFKDH